MPKEYNQNEIVEKIESVIRDNRIATLYKEPYIKRKGKTRDLGESYSEVVSEKLLVSNIKALFSTQVKRIGRPDYKVEHKGKINEKSNRDEEILAIRLKNKDLKYLGRILEYQIPLKSSNFDKGIGKIDLVSISNKRDRVFIIELKAKNSIEGLLKGVLEIATYALQLNQEKFLRDMHNPGKLISKAVLLEKGSQGYREAHELDLRPNLKELIKCLDVKLFLLENRTNYLVRNIAL